MSDSPDDLPFTTIDQIDAICDRFEKAWTSGQRPRIEDYVDQLPVEIRSQALRALLRVELELRRRAAESPSAAEYEARFPASIDDVRRVFHESRVQDSSARKLGYYLLLEKIGEGGMGAVYRARHDKLRKIVAVKVLPRDFLRNSAAVARFEREMRSVGALNHPHIVQAHDAGEVEGTHYLVMEYLEGGDLSQQVRESGPLPYSRACELIVQAARGLQHAHEQHLVHRDIKPSNLFLTKSGQVKLLDLGLSRTDTDADEGSQLTTTGQSMGTPDYMAPEQWDDSSRVSARSDLYSLGCTLFFLIAGRAPFATDQYRTPHRKMAAHHSAPIPPLRSVAPDVPEELDAIYQRLLAKDPRERFGSSAELVEALTPFCTHATDGLSVADHRYRPELSKATATSIAESRTASSRRNVFRAAGVCFVLLGLGYAWVTRDHQVPSPAANSDATAGAGDAGHNTTAQTPLFGNQPEKFTPTPRPEEARAAETGPETTETEAAWPARVEPIEPIEQWLEGREVLTVAQDGSAMYTSIAAAANDLKAGQVVRILDSGPYRESFRIHLPDDVGIVSTVGTRIEASEYQHFPAGDLDKGRLSYFVWCFGGQRMRLSGLTIHAIGPVPDDAQLFSVLHASPCGDTVVDNCRFEFRRAVGRESPNSQPGYGAATMYLLTYGVGTFNVQIEGCDFEGDQVLVGDAIGDIAARTPRMTFTRNRIVSPGVGLGFGAGRTQLQIRENVIVADRGIQTTLREPSFGDFSKQARVLIANNTIVASMPLFIERHRQVADAEYPFPSHVAIQNNVFRTKANCGIHFTAEHGAYQEDLAWIRNHWHISHNAYIGTVRPKIAGTDFPLQSSDIAITDADAGLNFDVHSRDYLRLASTSPLAVSGVGEGDGKTLPDYRGAFPPGPAPVEADWFSRIRERHDARLIRFPQVQEPPGLEEWLEGRRLRTVSQDAGGEFRTIGAALLALQPGEAVQVLDVGPYKESLQFDTLPADTGLFSRMGTVIEPDRWTEIPGANWKVAHRFNGERGFRLHGCTFQINRPPDTIGAGIQAAAIVLENCRLLDEPGREGQLPLTLSAGVYQENPERTLIIRDSEIQGRLDLMLQPVDSVALVARNYLHGWNAHHLSLSGTAGTIAVRNNVFWNDNASGIWVSGVKRIRLEFVGNTILTAFPIHFEWPLTEAAVTIRENIFGGVQGLRIEKSPGRSATPPDWTVGENLYANAISVSDSSALPLSPTDRVANPGFLSLQPKSPDFLRPVADGPAALKANAASANGERGAAVRRYIGALPPGPAPEGGDWFGRLRDVK